MFTIRAVSAPTEGRPCKVCSVKLAFQNVSSTRTKAPFLLCCDVYGSAALLLISSFLFPMLPIM